ncbi:MAG: rhomboid family intramembrane serine protease [bacterium]|jgi:membrane associated rhomboid family serine protease
MGYRENWGSSRSRLWNAGNPLVMLMIIHAMFFILLQFIKSLYTFSSIQDAEFYKNIYQLFTLSGDPEKLITQPWTLITMQFSEIRLMVVIGNLIWIWTFGYLVQDLLGDHRLFPIFIYSAFVSGIAFILAADLVLGEQAKGLFYSGIAPGILGLATAATMVSPHYRFFPMINGGIPLWVIAVIYFMLDLASISSNMFLLIPHVFGALTGFFFVWMLRRGNDIGRWMNLLASHVRSWSNSPKKSSFAAKSSSFYEQGSRSPYVKKTTITQQRIDAILDKINQRGYDNLSEEEKKILKEASNEDL